MDIDSRILGVLKIGKKMSTFEILDALGFIGEVRPYMRNKVYRRLCSLEKYGYIEVMPPIKGRALVWRYKES
jgi:hypothetical protein